MLRGTLNKVEDAGRYDYPETLPPEVEERTSYEVRIKDAASLYFTTREAARTVSHRINVYSAHGDTALVVKWWEDEEGWLHADTI